MEVIFILLGVMGDARAGENCFLWKEIDVRF